jgi:alpha-galactosidase
MNLDLSSDRLAFHLRLPEGTWDLHFHAPGEMSIEGAKMGAMWTRGKRPMSWNGSIVDPTILSSGKKETIHGMSEEASVQWSIPGAGLGIQLDCSLLLDVPLFLWRLRIENTGADPIRLETIEMMRVGRGARTRIKPRPWWMLPMGPAEHDEQYGALRLHHSPGDPAFFTNGWQSWGYTGALGRGDRFPRTRFGPLTKPMRVNAGTPRPRSPGHFASNMFAAVGDRRSRHGIAAGFLSEHQAFGSLEAELDALEPRLRLWANTDDVRIDPGESFSTDWACLQPFGIDDQDPIAPYLDAVAKENSARRPVDVPVGWCSWYQFFDSVTHDDVIENLEWAATARGRIPFDLIQLDDGFQAQVGDWFQTKDSFPDGVAGIARRAKDEGFTPGIWLAPLIVRPEARIVKEHPDWLLRGRGGRPVHAGFIWNRFNRALDPTHPAVLDHLQRMMETAAVEWGYDYLKLDFLYAGALKAVRHNPKVTRAQGLRHALSVMREAAGDDVFMLGCGCPLGSGIGIFDAMRISADVAPSWNPAYLGMELPFRSEPDFPAARNAIRNTITRAPMHRRWWLNDPDCLLMRGSDTKLNQHEVQTLATVIALSAGSLIVSDDLPSLDDQRIRWLAKLLPPLPKEARAIDWFDEKYPSRLVLPLADEAGDRYLVAFLNWDDKPRQIRSILDGLPLPPAQAYHAVDFWEERYMRIASEMRDPLEIPGHGIRLLALRQVQDQAGWIGDTLHISQGRALQRWRARRNTIKADLHLERQAEGKVWISTPTLPRSITLGGKSLDWQAAGENIYEFDVTFEGQAALEIQLV